MSPTRYVLAAAAVSTLIAAPLAASAQTPAPAAEAAPAPAATAADYKPVAVQGDLVDTLKLSGQFKTFVGGIDATNLTGLLKTNKNLTVFAPTDAAFAAMPADQLAKLKADKTAMQKFVLMHVVNAPIDSTKMKGAKGPVPSGAGDQILLDGSAEDGTLKVDGATIVQADVRTASGLLHVVDHVLVEGTPAAAEAAAVEDAATSAPTNP
ncbi:MAG: fasciclin domain-containing protein [Pseudomonadota bacterium]